MDTMTATRVLQLVNECARALDTVGPSLRDSSDKSLALYRLHSAAILGAALSYVAVPIWNEKPDLQEATQGEAAAEFRMSPDAVAAALGALEHVKKAMANISSMLDAAELPGSDHTNYAEGIRKVIGYVDEAVDVISRHKQHS
jgi:hypothetical protein